MNRIEKVIKRINELNLDAFFVTETSNIRYITNFTGEDAFLLIKGEKIYLIVDSRFTTQANEEVFKGVTVLEYKPPLTEFLEKLFVKEKIHWLGVEKNRITADLYLSLSGIPFIKVAPLNGIIENLRMVKDAEELETIRRACEISSKSFKETLPFIKEGVSEKDIASELEYRFRKNGAEKTSFDTIVASGWRGALPHGLASDKKVKAHELIVMDFGVFYKGYASDTTRTVSIGEPAKEDFRIYEIVREAQKLGRDFVKQGVICAELDKKVRDYIDSKGYGKYFIHGLGHGVGLEIHELPFVNGRSDIELKEGMIITVEPGIYLKDRLGVRIEDTILVRKNSGEVLTKLPHELIKL